MLALICLLLGVAYGQNTEIMCDMTYSGSITTTGEAGRQSYDFTIPAGLSSVSFSTCSAATTIDDTYLYAWDECNYNFDWNDDDWGCAFDTFFSNLTLDTTGWQSGAVITIQVGQLTDSSTGAFELMVECDNDGQGASADGYWNYWEYDTCPGSDTTTMTPITTIGDLSCGNTEEGMTTADEPTMWYSFEVTGDGDYYSFSTCGSDYDTYVWVYSWDWSWGYEDDDSALCSDGLHTYLVNAWLDAGNYYVGIGGCCSLDSSNYGNYMLTTECGYQDIPTPGEFYPVGDCKYYDAGSGLVLLMDTCYGASAYFDDSTVSTSYKWDCDGDTVSYYLYDTPDCSGTATDSSTTDSTSSTLLGWAGCVNPTASACATGNAMVTYYENTNCTGDVTSWSNTPFLSGCQSDGYSSERYTCDGEFEYYNDCTDCSCDPWDTSFYTIDTTTDCWWGTSFTYGDCVATSAPGDGGDDTTGGPDGGDDGSASGIFCGIAFLVTLIANIF